MRRADVRRSMGRSIYVVALLAIPACLPLLGGPDEYEDEDEDDIVEASPPRTARPTAAPSAGDAGQPGWQDAVFARIAQGEYAIRRAESGLSAFNRAQNLRATFSSDGVRVAQRVPEKKDAGTTREQTKLRMVTASIGRPAARVSLGPASFAVGACRKDGALDEMGACLRRAEARYTGVTEWWENTPDGLEQGFDIAQRPRGEGPLHITVRVDAAHARIDEGAHSATIVLQSGHTMRYGKLLAEDANRRVLPIRLVPAPGGLTIEVDDAGATYPVRVDPLLTPANYLQGTEQAGANFGACISAAGDVNGDGFGDVMVGAPSHDGAFIDGGKAYLFRGRATGLDTSPVWTAEGASVNAAFGCPISAGDVNGDGYGDVVVAAPLHDNGQTDEGAVYLYRGMTGGILEPSGVMIERNVANARFGAQVQVAGDIDKDGFGDLAVVASGTNQMTVFRGSAASGLNSTPILAYTTPASSSGPMLAAGDVNADGYGDVLVARSSWSAGSASTTVAVFLGRTSGFLPMSTADIPNRATRTAAIIGDTHNSGRAELALGGTDPAGAPRTTLLCHSGTLAVCESFSSPAEKLSPAGDVNGDGYADLVSFGTALNGQQQITLVTGGNPYGFHTHLIPASGAQPHTLAAAGDVNGDGFADVLVGLPNYDGTQAAQGRVQLYTGAPVGLGPVATEVASPLGAAGAHFGSSVAGLGDVNGDGYGDIAIAATDYMGKGAAWVYQGTATGVATAAVWSRFAPAADDECSVAAAGDVDGDGYADLLVSHPRYYGNDRGWVGLYRGDPLLGVNTSPLWTEAGTQADSRFGMGIASAGDVNADGYADIAVAAPLFNSGSMVDNGRVHVYLGGPSGPGTPIVLEGACAGGRFGYAMAGVHDMDGDRIDDLGIASPWCGGGKVVVLAGSATPSAVMQATLRDINNAQVDARFGVSLAGPGDVNGDGYADLFAGAHLFDGTGLPNSGRASLHFGGPTPPPDWEVIANEADARLGRAVGAAGDVNGDGLGDLIVGAPSALSNDQGRALLFLGAGGSPSTTAAWGASETSDTSSEFGAAVTGAGDVNGDGYSDVLVAAPMADSPSMEDAGRVFLYFGNNGKGTTNGPRFIARRFATTTPIPPGGKTGPAFDFDVSFHSKNPAGRSPIRPRIQAVAHGMPWGTWELYAYSSTSPTGEQLTGTVHTYGKGAIPHFRARGEYLPSATPAWSLFSPWNYGGVLGDRYGVAIRGIP